MKKIITIMILCILLLTGCQSEGKEYQTTLNEFLNLYQNGNGSAAKYLSNYADGEEIEFEGLQKLFAMHLEYKIGKVEKDKENSNLAYVNATVKNMSFEKAFEIVLQKCEPNMVEEEILRLLEEEILKESIPMAEFKIKVPVQKMDDRYEIILNGELSNALMGGLNEYLSVLTGGIQDE